MQDSIQKKEVSIRQVRGDHNLSDILTKPIGGAIFNMHVSRMHFTFPGSNLKLNLCSSAHRVCTHDPLRPRGRGGVFGLMGPQVHGVDYLLQYRYKLRSSSRLP